MRESTGDRASEKRWSEAYRSRRTAVMFATLSVLLLAAMVLAGTFGGILPEFWGAMLMLLDFAAAALLNAVIWRCPACHAHLGKLFIGLRGPRFCQNCGVRLEGGEDAV